MSNLVFHKADSGLVGAATAVILRLSMVIVSSHHFNFLWIVYFIYACNLIFRHWWEDLEIFLAP